MTIPFQDTLFLRDIADNCKVLDAPYSEAVTRKVLRIYATSFARGAVLWRITDDPNDGLNYRFYEREPMDLVDTAVSAGLLGAKHPLIPLLVSWTALYPECEQSCDFDAKKGLTKIWVFLGGMRPIDEVFGVPHLPDSVKRWQPKFKSLGLELVRHVAIDWHSSTINIYFRAKGLLTLERANSLVSLSNTPPLREELVDEMRHHLNPIGCTFAVTISNDTGEISRVGIYALRLRKGDFPHINTRLRGFFDTSKNYDADEMNAIAWSFSKQRSYIKAEKSYCGKLVELMTGWNSPMTAPVS